MEQRFAGRTVVVSGGATGIGAAAVERFAAEGARVACVDRNVKEGADLASRVREQGGIVEFFAADLTRPDEIARAIAGVVDRLGAPTILFNHAGAITIKRFLDITLADCDALISTNLISMILMTQAVIPHMLASGGGAIVCTSSVSAELATPCEVLYGATKAACQMFARGIAIEFRDRHIRCNSVSPGFVRTSHGLREIDALQALGVDVSEASLADLQGRLCEPREIAEAVLFLASDAASFVTGSNLVVDNGFSAQ